MATTDISDIAFFAGLLRLGSLRALAQELGVTPPVISKRLQAMERRLGVRLLNRTTRAISTTHEGDIYLAGGARILEQVAELEQNVTRHRGAPAGLLRVDATLGFGRMHVGPAVEAFVRAYPEVEVQLHLSDRPAQLADDAFDVGIRLGAPPDARVVARLLARNRRFLYAAPAYLARAGVPATPKDLQQHQCIVLRESDAAYGTWPLQSGARQESVKVRGGLSTNHGEVALDWALAGAGVVMRSEWEAAGPLRAGALVRVLEGWSTPSADIHAIHAPGLNLPAKVRAFVDFLADRFAAHRPTGRDTPPW